VVHNAQVTQRLTDLGLRFVETLEEIPPGATVLFSAHGVAPAVRAAAQARHLRVIDATCPFVAKVHRETARFAAAGCTVVCIGHRAHAEVIGIAGEAPQQVVVVENADEAGLVSPPDPGRIAMVTQTTLSPEIADRVREVLRARFPALQQPAQEDVCYATRNRQQAVRAVAAQADLVLVLGSPNSSNTRRLVETARHAGGSAHLIGRAADLAAVPLRDCRTVGITSGASTPEEFLDAIVAELAAYGFTIVEHLHIVPEPNHAFRLPPM
jgi:4-hydroxy-3-methylbut-2-enyl diphosphate reductase